MRIVVAIDERVAEGELARLPRLLLLHDVELLLVHVLDTGGRDEWERGAAHRLLHHGPPHAHREQMSVADRQSGERLLARAASVASVWPGVQVSTRLLEGSPKHEIRRLLDDEGVATVVVFVHGHEVGPKSIGKEARFLIDHASCPVLVVKESDK